MILFVCCCLWALAFCAWKWSARTKWNVLRGSRWCLEIIFYFSHCFFSSHFVFVLLIFRVVSLEICFIGFLLDFAARRGEKKEWIGKESEKLSLLECSDNKRKLVRWIFSKNLACWGHEKYTVETWNKTWS